MSENTNGTVTVISTPDLELAEYGRREDVHALARRIKSMMPGGEKLTDEQAMSAAQYSIVLDANIFRGEVYAWTDKDNHLHLTDGYKVLVRWARRQCNYTERYELLDRDSGIGYRCHILRSDNRDFLKTLIEAGLDVHEALEIASSSAVGIVHAGETNRRAPHGWTWDQVARKRALKNALNLSHGAPSPREIAAESWQVGNVETTAADWAECTPDMLPEARERLAALTAADRQRRERGDDREPEEILDENREILHGKQEETEI